MVDQIMVQLLIGFILMAVEHLIWDKPLKCPGCQ